MLDGVRRQEFFGGLDRAVLRYSIRSGIVDKKDGINREYTERELKTEVENRLETQLKKIGLKPGDKTFARFHKKHASRGTLYGLPDSDVHMWLANSVMLSLPAYRSIFAGAMQRCFSNKCGWIKSETLMERLIREGTPRKRVAGFASWETMDRAMSRSPDTVIANTGNRPFESGDAVHKDINRRQKRFRPPWGKARYDRYTLAHALRYLDREKPSFLYISLNDADEWAHKKKYGEYVEILQSYDRWIDDLIKKIDRLPGRTTLFILTDHGRGFGERWGNHGFVLDATPIWLYVYSTRSRIANSRGRSPDFGKNLSKLEGRKLFTHLDIRPTIEVLLGLKPVDCLACGQVLRAPLEALRE